MSAPARPAPTAPRAYNFPAVERAVMANGVRLVVAPMPRLPLVTVLALVDAGASTDLRGREGLAALTARTLTEGIAGLDGAALTDRFESLGTSVESYADWDSTVARFTVTPAQLDAAFALFCDVLRAPSFPEADVSRRRDERLASLEQRLSEPRGLADQRFSGFLYGASSRYGRPVGGTKASVTPLDAAQVRAFHEARYAPAVTSLIFVGDITVEEARRLAERRLGDWTVVGRPSETGENRQREETRHAFIVDKAGAPQTELRVGHVGVPRSDPKHLDIVVMNALLGGLFSSRINLNLRERHAFTYGASSGFDWRRDAGPFVVSAAVKSEITHRAVEEILLEIDGMRAAPPSASELALATDYLAGVFPIRYESTDAVAGAIANATIFSLPDDWFSTYRDRVQAVSPEDVHAAANSHLDPPRLQVVAVGDATVIGESLAALPLGPVKVVAAADDPAEESPS